MQKSRAWLAALTLAVPALAAAQTPPGDKPAAGETSKSEPFKPEQQASKGTVTVSGRRLDYDAVAGTLIVHARDWDDAQPPDRDDKGGPPEASMFYVAYFASAPKGSPRPITFVFNGGPGSATMWLHMGALRPEAGGDRRRHAHAGRALPDRQQRFQPARRQRSGVHRRARHRLQPHRRQGPRKGVLWRRPGRARLRRIHHTVPRQVRALELTEVSVRRKLRHDAVGGAGESAPDRALGRPERRDPAVADPELRRKLRPRRVQSRDRPRLRSWHCRPMPPLPGTTTCCRTRPRICRRCSPRSSTSR